MRNSGRFQQWPLPVGKHPFSIDLSVIAPLRDCFNLLRGGLTALTRDLAAKWARHGIRVNAIAS
jgi:hypothetical protein